MKRRRFDQAYLVYWFEDEVNRSTGRAMLGEREKREGNAWLNVWLNVWWLWFVV